MVNIPLGAELYFSRNNDVKATVVGRTGSETIEFNGQRTSLSKAAQEVLGYSNAVSGTAYWSYEGETLDERRQRIEESE